MTTAGARTTTFPRLVVFEGIDGAGKTTTCKLFSRLTGHRYLAVDRFIFSNAAYDIIFGRTGGGRPTTEAYMRAVAKLEDEGMLTIFLDASPEDCYERMLRGPGDEYSVRDLRRHRGVFLDLILGGGRASRMVLNTAGKVPQEVVDEAIAWVESFER